MFQLVQVAPGEAFFNNSDSHFVGYAVLGTFATLAAAKEAKTDLCKQGQTRLAVWERS